MKEERIRENMKETEEKDELLTVDFLGKPDVSLFNFTNRHMSDEAAVLVPSSSQRDSSLLVGLVGDALLQPFWPLGTGLNRAILSSLDTAWMLREIKLGSIEEAVTNRNRTYLMMKNALAGSIQQPFGKVTVDPVSRYVSPGL
eukprot:TRINITY_DN698_c0_g1_i2.p1 TRINITY_DN698_c0_g1~~TRINITY_DN698_c0_g1_i2.p1  ORF type:complete len:143 (+),score=23.12 TRINITY_DN698_c0_g1_i2:500-928(+)